MPTWGTATSPLMSYGIAFIRFAAIAGTQKVGKQKFEFRIDGLLSSTCWGTLVGCQPVMASAQMLKRGVE